jgi:UDP-N-acetyl-D-mannosaminuronate dehydrogenase
MNRRQKSPQPRTQAPAYRQAFERLDAALEENTPSDNTEKIRLMRLAYFADVDELQKSGTLKIPE